MSPSATTEQSTVWVRRRPTASAGTVLLFAVGSVPIAVIGTWSGFWIINSILMVIVLVDLVRAPRPWSLEVATPAVLITQVGKPEDYSVSLVNRSRREVRTRVRVAWPPSVAVSQSHFDVSIPGQVTQTLGIIVTPHVGGSTLAGPVAVRTSTPWGLAAWQADCPQQATLQARPAHPSARILPAKLAELAYADGRTALRQRGEGTEFDALRDYVRGDDRRSIDWRATARTSKVMVRTWQPERDRRLLIAVDCGRLSAARFGDTTRLSIFVDALLLLTSLATHAGDSVDVIAFSRQVNRRVSTRSRAGSTGEVGVAFTGLMPDLIETDYRALGSEIMRRSRQRQAVVVMTSFSTAAGAERLLPSLRVVSSRNPTLLAHVHTDWPSQPVDPTTDAYREAVAQMTAQRINATNDLLAASGIATLVAPPEPFAGALADKYLQWRVGTPAGRWGATAWPSPPSDRSRSGR
jgi:uncharacterized protein (DUF58 family)